MDAASLGLKQARTLSSAEQPVTFGLEKARTLSVKKTRTLCAEKTWARHVDDVVLCCGEGEK